MKVIVAALAALLVLTACSSGGKKTTQPSAPKSAAFVTSYGQDAALLAGHVPNCTDVTAGDIGAGAETGGVSLATCTMSGHQVSIYTWKDAASESGAVLIGKEQPFSASGTGWTEFVGGDAGADVHRAAAEAFAAALGGQVETP